MFHWPGKNIFKKNFNSLCYNHPEQYQLDLPLSVAFSETCIKCELFEPVQQECLSPFGADNKFLSINQVGVKAWG